MTLNQIAEDIAYKLGDQFNNTLKESIKHTVIFYRSKYLRDDDARNGSTSPHLFQSVVMQMEEVNKLEDVGASISCITEGGVCMAVIDNKKYRILKSKKKLPIPVRLKGYGTTHYRFIGSVDRSTRFSYSEPIDLKYKLALPYQNSATIFFFIANNDLYLLNNLDICDVLLDAVYENPRDAYEACDEDGVADDKYFPLPLDMLVSITDGIVTKTYPLRGADGQTVNIQKDDKDKDNV